MLKDGKITYCPPPFEEVQNEPTVMSTDGSIVLQSSFHSDVSLLMRISALDKLTAQQYSTLKEQLQPLIDSSSLRDEFEQSFGKLTDDELLRSCPSRYLQTQSEQKCYLESLAAQDKECRAKAAEEAKTLAEKKRISDEEIEFQSRLAKFLKS
ncbi:Uncharacterised protein [Chlamydia trachomatis]|nr:Uncharacterised protein [Chlamydia trachomatis]